MVKEEFEDFLAKLKAEPTYYGEQYIKIDELPKSQILANDIIVKNPKQYLILEGKKYESYEYPDLLVAANLTHFN